MPEATNKPGRGRPKTMIKADVVDVAMGAYWQEGPAKVSLNAICQRAGVSKPSIYREFGNDDGLAHAALETYTQAVLGKLMAILDSDDEFLTKIKKLIHLIAVDPTHENGCLFVKMRAAAPMLGPKTQELVAQVGRISLDACSKVLTEARASGAWQGDIPVSLGAHYLQAQIGLALDQRARGEDPEATLGLALSVFEPTQGT